MLTGLTLSNVPDSRSSYEIAPLIFCDRCFCKPCIKAFEVDVFECHHPDDYIHVNRHIGCKKMSICTTVMQTKQVPIRIRDNLKRDDAEVFVKMHLASETYDIPVIKVDAYRYKFIWSSNMVGIGVLEVYINGEQIPESPMRLEVVKRNWILDYPGEQRDADSIGNCVCKDGTVEIRGKCVSTTILAVVLSCVFSMLALAAGWCVVSYKNRQNDLMWMVSVDELHFDDPPEICGQGSFGVVLLGESKIWPV